MRSESESFRTWKLMREREICKLKDQDRKRQNAMVKMETKHSKQQNVLKRKVEEAAAINKRLMNALARQNNVQSHRQLAGQGKAEHVRSWVDQELEVLLSTIDAERTLVQLMDDRAMISKRLQTMKADKITSAENSLVIKQLEDDLALRSAQISDFQEKIIASDQENKSRTRWDTVQSMVDAKCALKHLFEVAADIRREAVNNEHKNEELQNAHQEALESVSLHEKNVKDLIVRHKSDLFEMEKEHETKIAVLLRQLRDGNLAAGDSQLQDRIRIQDEALEKMEERMNELEHYKQECQHLKEQLESVAHIARKPKSSTNLKKQATTAVIDLSDDEVNENSDCDDSERDPDYRNTPMFRRVQKCREMVPTSRTALKRSSDGLTKCCCKGNCANRVCGCKKLNVQCSSSCKCSTKTCSNRLGSDKENIDDNTSRGADDSTEDKKRPRTSDENSLQPVNKNLQKKRLHF